MFERNSIDVSMPPHVLVPWAMNFPIGSLSLYLRNKLINHSSLSYKFLLMFFYLALQTYQTPSMSLYSRLLKHTSLLYLYSSDNERINPSSYSCTNLSITSRAKTAGILLFKTQSQAMLSITEALSPINCDIFIIRWSLSNFPEESPWCNC